MQGPQGQHDVLHLGGITRIAVQVPKTAVRLLYSLIKIHDLLELRPVLHRIRTGQQDPSHRHFVDDLAFAPFPIGGQTIAQIDSRRNRRLGSWVIRIPGDFEKGIADQQLTIFVSSSHDLLGFGTQELEAILDHSLHFGVLWRVLGPQRPCCIQAQANG